MNLYIYKVKDITLYQSKCKHFTNLDEFKNYLKACIENFKRDFNVDESGDTFVRVNDRLVGKDRIFRLLPWEDGDNECDYNYIDKYESVRVMINGDFAHNQKIFKKYQILSANKDGNPFDENFYGNFPYYVKINNEVHCLSLEEIQNENHTYVETLMIELVYENDFGLKIKSFKFICFLVDGSHFKKRASPKKKKKASSKAKKASQKKKRASPKKKKASQKKRASPKKKKASPKPKKSYH